MHLSSVSTIQKSSRHRSHRNASSVVHHNTSGDYGNPTQVDAIHLRSESHAVDDYLGMQNRMSDRTKRSDTSKRHILARQKPIHKDDHQTPNNLRCNMKLYLLFQRTEKCNL